MGFGLGFGASGLGSLRSAEASCSRFEIVNRGSFKGFLQGFPLGVSGVSGLLGLGIVGFRELFLKTGASTSKTDSTPRQP